MVPSFQSPLVPTQPQYAVNARPAKGTNAAPVKAKPTSEKAFTRRIFSQDSVKTSGNENAASPQTKGIISEAEELAEYNATEQSYAGYNDRKNEEKFYNISAKQEDDRGVFPENNVSSSFTTEFLGKENTTVQQPKDKGDKNLPENDSLKEGNEKNAHQNEKHSSDETDYKDEIEKEAVEQEKEADKKAEQEGPQNDEDDDDDDSDDNDDDNDDDDDDDDDDERSNNGDIEEDIGHSSKDSMKQDDGNSNPADKSFAVSPTIVPGMCPPCRKYCCFCGNVRNLAHARVNA